MSDRTVGGIPGFPSPKEGWEAWGTVSRLGIKQWLPSLSGRRMFSFSIKSGRRTAMSCVSIELGDRLIGRTWYWAKVDKNRYMLVVRDRN